MIIEDLKVYGKFVSFEIGKKLQKTPNFCQRLEHLEFKQLKFFNKNVTENPEKQLLESANTFFMEMLFKSEFKNLK